MLKLLDPVRHPQPVDRQRRRRRLARVPVRLGQALGRLAQHLVDERVDGQLAGRRGRDHLAVAHHGDPVAQLEDLAEAVGDEQDGAAGGRDLADGRVDVLALDVAERGRRLVEDDQPGVLAEGPGDLDQLALADAELGEPLVEARRGRARRCRAAPGTAALARAG